MYKHIKILISKKKKKKNWKIVHRILHPSKKTLEVFNLFKNRPSKILGRQPYLKCYGLLYQLKLFKGCLPQVLLGPFLNTVSQIFQKKHNMLNRN